MKLVYNLKYNEWTKIKREDGNTPVPLQVGFQVKDKDGKIYTYGASDNGYLYRLENGRTWDGTPIRQVVWTKDLLLDEESKPLFNFTQIRRFRLLFKPKPDATSSESINITHYGDNGISVSGTTQTTISSINMADVDGRYGQSCKLGPYLRHSFKFEAETSNVDDGMELIGMGLYYTPSELWRQ